MKALLILPFMMLAACASVQKPKPLTHQDHIKVVYEDAEKAFANKEYERAVKQFEEVRSKYPYSKYAALSDLRLGDVFFEQERWLEAADAYDFYLKFHPRHENNAFAAFRIAKAYVNAKPKDFFLFPKSFLRDQSSTEDALFAIDRFLSRYPEHESAKEALAMKIKLRSEMAKRDLNIAEFYIKRKKLEGAKFRLKYVQETYSDTPEAELALKKLEALSHS
ncbi:MAG: tetratricopeptide repeat protein [Deltaproteobacteria bacterium]|nr:tetratricopeptide repeat protein [Deltaproteobacteria bacterium]